MNKTTKEISRTYYLKHREEIIRKKMEYNKKPEVKKKMLGYKKIWRARPENKEKQKQDRIKYKKKYPNWWKDYYQKKRMICIEHYSENKNCCKCCGENKIEFLSIDHINGGGTKHRKEIGGGQLMYQWLIKNNFPKGFRILCFNCNQSLGIYGYCPHKVNKRISDVINKNI